MSSPNRAAKPRGKTRGKVAPKPGVKARNPKRAVPSGETDAAVATAPGRGHRFAATLDRSLVDGSSIGVGGSLQAVMAAACRLYAAHVDAGEQFLPVPPRSLPRPTSW